MSTVNNVSFTDPYLTQELPEVSNDTPELNLANSSYSEPDPESDMVFSSVPQEENAIYDTPTASSSSITWDGIGVIAGSGDVMVEIMNSESAYVNQIYWSADNFQTINYLGDDDNPGVFNIGSFAPGTRIQFGIDNGENFFKASVAEQNADGIEHAQVTRSDNSVTLGFEDLFGGGDGDFNDAIIRVTGSTSSEQTAVENPVTTIASQDYSESTDLTDLLTISSTNFADQQTLISNEYYQNLLTQLDTIQSYLDLTDKTQNGE